MATYQEWNNEIFKYYFANSDMDDTPLFSVNKESLNIISKNLQINGDPINDFVKCVLREIGGIKNNRYKLSLNDKLITNDKDSPYQTAIIAFFIYVASRMGNNKNYNPNAYWKIIEDYVKEFFGDPNIQELKIDKSYFDLFRNFENKLNQMYNIKFIFENPFTWSRIGIPMFQAMITEKDYCLLTQKFEKYKDKYRNSIRLYQYISEDTNKYSYIFRNLCETDRIEHKQKIEQLYKNWDGTILEYDETTKKRKRKSINLLYGYQEERKNVFQFFITADARDDYDDIEFSDFILRKQNDSKYYKLEYYDKRGTISEEKISLRNILKYAKNISNLSLKRKQMDHIKLKFIDNNYIEHNASDGIRVGDRFSIIAKKDFFDKRFDDIQNLAQDDIESKFYKIDGYENLYLLHDIEAIDYDNDIVAFNVADKIFFRKGLKSNEGNYTWINGAEPIIDFKDMTSIKIDNKKEKNNRIDIRDQYNELDVEHCIKLDKSNETKHYKIISIENMAEENDFKEMYYAINNNKIIYTEDFNCDIPMIVGANIKNVKCILRKKSFTNKRKLTYIMKILEQHQNAYKYIMPKATKETLLNISNQCDKNDATKLLKFIEENKYIDNYIHSYLNNIKELVV